MRQAQADPVVLTFDGLQGGEPILNFYNGGSGGSGSGPGPNFGVTFSANAVVLAGGNPAFFFRPPK